MHPQFALRPAGLLHNYHGRRKGPATGIGTDCIPPGSVQWLENTGQDEVEFLCVVDPA
ncbi:hypothetical protein JXD38_05355 [candidate division WOR-3 bacterium]|nr:hypothetical protein [candidate division WOR-3 bacterium]